MCLELDPLIVYPILSGRNHIFYGEVPVLLLDMTLSVEHWYVYSEVTWLDISEFTSACYFQTPHRLEITTRLKVPFPA